jgi:nitrogen fixation protein NifX
MTLERRLKLVTTDAEALEMEIAIKVAFATSKTRPIDKHSAAADTSTGNTHTKSQAILMEVLQFGQLAMDGNEDKLAGKIDALDGCIAVYCQAVGASAVNQLRSKGIQAVKVSPGSEIQGLVEDLQDELRKGPSAWLARALEQYRPRHASRFDDMEQEGWVE